jgi:hypothetical protein
MLLSSELLALARSLAAGRIGLSQQRSAAFSILCRGFQHRDMRTVCEAIRAPTLRVKYQSSLRKASVSQDMKDFADALPLLQDARHSADYDPAARFSPSDVSSIIDSAEVAIDAFDRADVEEKTDVLALMMVGARG